MTLEQIKKAVEDGKTVCWSNDSYEVVNDSIGQWLIECQINGHCIGLTKLDEKTMNGEENEFFIKERK